MEANGPEPEVFNETRLLFNYSGIYDADYVPRAGGPPYGLMDAALQKALELLHHYYMPLLCAVGILGNTVASVVLFASDLTHLSVTQFLLGKVLVDVLFLVSLLHRWVTETFHVFLYDVGGWCNFITFLHRASAFLSLWYTFCFVVDVFIRVYLEGFTARLCTPWRAKIITIGFAVVAVVVYLNISLTFGVTYVGQNGAIAVCTPLAQFASTTHNLDRADIVINVTLPYTCMLVLVTMVGARVVRVAQQPAAASRIGLQQFARHRHQDRHHQQGSSPSNRGPLRDPEKQLGRVFMTLTLSYLVLSLPLQCMRMYVALQDRAPQSDLLTEVLWREVFQFVHFTNMAINFLIFLFSFGRFREQGYILVQQLFHRSRRTHDPGSRAQETVDIETVVTHHFAQDAKRSACNSGTAV